MFCNYPSETVEGFRRVFDKDELEVHLEAVETFGRLMAHGVEVPADEWHVDERVASVLASKQKYIFLSRK